MLLYGPILARYAVRHPAMNDLVTEGKHDPKGIARRTHIGLWKVERPQAYTGGVWFTIRDTVFLDRGGLAYNEYGSPPNLEDGGYYEHLQGNRYTWKESW